MSDSEKLPGVARREFLAGALRGAALWAVAPAIEAGWALSPVAAAPNRPVKAGLLLRSSRPLDLETPVERFTSYLTSQADFFVRTHHDEPRMDAKTWHLAIGGLVERPISLSLAELQAMPAHIVTAVLQCSGNGRSHYRPRVPGVPWDKGAVGNARWTGVRLADVLARAGYRANGAHVVLQGADRPVMAQTPRFGRSIPMAKALHPDTILAYAMNDRPLPVLHGHPLRAIVPGWVGDDWVKWLVDITVQDEPFGGFFYQTAYRYPTRPVDFGVAVPPDALAPMTDMPVKSLIALPSVDAVLTGRPVMVEGVAWTGGDALVIRVEFSDDGGRHWTEAELLDKATAYAWRRWRFLWTPPGPGAYNLLARATDDRGQTQPLDASPWNPSGYLWNAADAVPVAVKARTGP